MLYVLIEAQRAWLDKVQKDNELAKQETRIISEDKKSVETEPYGPGVLRPSLTKEPVSSLYPCQINDSEWFTLSPQKRYAFSSHIRNGSQIFCHGKCNVFSMEKWPLFLAKTLRSLTGTTGEQTWYLPYPNLSLLFYLLDWLGQKNPKTLGSQKVNGLL